MAFLLVVHSVPDQSSLGKSSTTRCDVSSADNVAAVGVCNMDGSSGK